jgi:pimeloyl-ACP methyl ester carboxylesterase
MLRAFPDSSLRSARSQSRQQFHQQLRRPRRVLPRTFAAAGLSLLAAAAAACGDAATAPRSAPWLGEIAPTQPAHPAAWTGERVLRVGSTTIQARIDRRTGVRKGPTVVLLSGLDTPLDVWAKVRTGLAGDAPVFSYDRGGVDRSGAVTGERPSSVVARELHATLAAAGLRPPYLLVAHSVAGVHARVFADRYRAEVAGVVLIDATHEMLLAGMTTEQIAEVAAGLKYEGSKAEVLAQRTSAAEVAASRLPDVPLAVITSMRPEADEPPGAREFLAALQAEWLHQVTRGEQVLTPVGHYVMTEAPETVLAVTRRVLAAARGAQ